MIILGLDPGLTRLGVGVVKLEQARKPQFESVRVLRTSPGGDVSHRLGALGGELTKIFDDVRPDAVALERVFAQHNVSTVMGTAQVSGVVMFLAAQREVPVTLYTPTEVKASVTGYGAADKAQVTAMVTKLLKLDTPPKPADAADALALAITHALRVPTVGRSSSTKHSNELTPAQLAWLAAEQRQKRPNSL